MSDRDLNDLHSAVVHCRAGLKALEAAETAARQSGAVYPTHIHVATVELAHAIELATGVALRSH